MFSLRNKLFLAFLLSSTLLVIGLLGFFQWSFDREFLRYINQVQQNRLDSLGSTLEQFYAKDGSWAALKDERVLHRLLKSQHAPREFMDDESDHPPRHRQGDHEGPPPLHLPPIFILDRDKQRVLGKLSETDKSIIQPLEFNGEIVGYVGMEKKLVPHEFMDQQFAANQSQHFIFIALIGLLVSGMVAFPLASLLVKRLGQLLRHIEQLSQGDYEHRIAMKGNDELNQLALHMNNLSSTLQQSAHSRRAMVADISHELRTPIAVLQAQLEAIEDGIQPMSAEAVQGMHQQVMRLSNLVNDLYELSLADVGAMTYRKQSLDALALIRSVALSFSSQLQQSNLALTLDSSTDFPLLVLGDEQRLHQLFSNLLRNSVQHTNSPGQVQISIVRKDAAVVIQIMDSAPGVAPELHQRLFERLFRVETSRNRNSGGAGLGLSLCEKIVQAHDGSITLTDSPLGGLAVTIELPLIAG